MKAGKTVLLLLALLMAALPGRGTEIGSLRPVELVWIHRQGDRICLRTDTGDVGMGATVALASLDLKNKASGALFLDTADYLLLAPDCLSEVPELWELLRPALRCCVVPGEVNPGEAAGYLRSHMPSVTLRGLYMYGEKPPVLALEEGDFTLVQ